MTDTIPAGVSFEETPDYDSFHGIFDEQAASNGLADRIDEYGKTEIDYEVPEETPEDAYPTVDQIEAGLAPESPWPTVAQIEAGLKKDEKEPEPQT